MVLFFKKTVHSIYCALRTMISALHTIYIYMHADMHLILIFKKPKVSTIMVPISQMKKPRPRQVLGLLPGITELLTVNHGMPEVANLLS